MDSLDISNQSIDVERLVDAFDIDNLLEILEISSLSTILNSESIENASNEQSDPISDPFTAFTENIAAEIPTAIEEEHTADNHSIFSQTTETREFYRILFKILLQIHLVSVLKYFNQQMNFARNLLHLTIDTIEGTITVNDEPNNVQREKSTEFIGNSHSVENTAVEFNQQDNESIRHHMITETNEIDVEIIFDDV